MNMCLMPHTTHTLTHSTSTLTKNKLRHVRFDVVESKRGEWVGARTLGWFARGEGAH